MNGKNITGQRIAEIRKEMGMTQTDLAVKLDKLDVHIRRTDLTKLEIGDRCVRDYELLAIARVLKISPQYLLTGRCK